MAAKFVAEEGHLTGLTLSLEKGDHWVIGRNPEECQLLIEDPSAADKHLVCRSSPEGILLENLSVTDPVHVNNEQVNGPRLLKNGDTVKIGNGLFRFYLNHDGGEEGERAMDEEKNDVESSEHETIFEETSSEDKGILAEIDFDLRESGRWLLKVVGGPNNGAEFSMQSGSSYVIGTDPTSCDVVFHDTSVSRQHARIAINDRDQLTIEDLKSRNGTLIDGQPIEGKSPLDPNTLITLGTTSFIVFDREGDMQTIISPLLPSIVKVLQQEDEKKTKDEAAAIAANAHKEEFIPAPPPKRNNLGALIPLGIIAALLVTAGIGTVALFRSEPIQIREEVDVDTELALALSPYPSVRFSYNKNTGRLLLVGHVMSLPDKNQLMYSLQGLEFLRSIDDSGLIIDEYIWRETNQVLGRDPRWKGINVHSPSAGKFVLSGYLQTRQQADDLNNYITANFPYLDLLERRVIVEESVLNSVQTDLENADLRNMQIQLNNGELTISGNASKEQVAKIDRLVRKFREIPGVRSVKTFVSEIAPELDMENITSKYKVTGFSHQGGVNLTVVINGRILQRGDTLDGMTITGIRPSVIFLEKDGKKFRIDYNQ